MRFVTATLTEAKRLQSTENGNPMFACAFVGPENEAFTARTMPDSQLTYTIESMVGKPALWEFKEWRGHLRVVGVEA